MTDTCLIQCTKNLKMKVFALASVIFWTSTLAASIIPGNPNVPNSCSAVENNPPGDKFCNDPPVVPVELPLYQGTWFLSYVSGSATQFSSDPCTTANYTLNEEGNVDVLNCAVRRPGGIPSCVRAVASQRPNTTASGKLSVLFPNAPRAVFNPGQYSVAALLGFPGIGYFSAAVYQCGEVPGVGNAPGFYILTRNLWFREFVLYLMKVALKCRGFDVNVDFLTVGHSRCNYFFEESGFTEFDPSMFAPPS
ncbi:unnamed protein product [Agarophyton chilense]|eukprot:gb/GEZJ01004292.1/.p1 GENE.gb/GEZJ01004292.1/~~gb/GEZJ01004292.1/.p1  ORF type:complete len:250 (-),score=13.65 gb/GEZJ01004292.1/:145-894(-)